NQAVDNRFMVVLKPDQLDVDAALAALGTQRTAKLEAGVVGKHKPDVNGRGPARLPVKTHIQIEKVRLQPHKIRQRPLQSRPVQLQLLYVDLSRRGMQLSAALAAAQRDGKMTVRITGKAGARHNH